LQFIDVLIAKYSFKCTEKRSYHRDFTMSKFEIMLIMILFHNSNYHYVKHSYQEKVCKHLSHLFSKVVSYNRFIELEREVATPRALFTKKVFLGKCTGISFVDGTSFRVCRNQRIYIHKTSKYSSKR